jgi:phage shock protein E
MNKIKFIIIFLLIISVIYFIYYKPIEINSNEARTNIANGNYDYIIDVRTDAEWSEGHNPNTIHIPIGSLVTELPEKIPNKNSRILFICKKGIRASAVTIIAKKLGYNNVQAMIGNYKDIEI